MAFKNEDRKSHIISTNDILRKASDEKFEKLITEIREANLEGIKSDLDFEIEGDPAGAGFSITIFLQAAQVEKSAA